MIFHALFDERGSVEQIDNQFIIDLHENLYRIPPRSVTPTYVKTHWSFSAQLPLLDRSARAICLVRNPIDVMMSVWDFKHLLGQDGLLEASQAEQIAKFEAYFMRWVGTGGFEFPEFGSWVDHVRSWLDQSTLPTLFVQYEKLKAEPLAQLQRVLSFIERPTAAEKLLAAVEAGKVENMRKREDKEVVGQIAGAFYRPELARGYSRGYRFVGRLHEGTAEKLLTPAARAKVDEVFGAIFSRAKERAG